MREKVLVLFSGGLDSMLTACKIIEDGYKAILVHYDNGCSSNSQVVIGTANRLIDRYGEDSARNVGDWNDCWLFLCFTKCMFW